MPPAAAALCMGDGRSGMSDGQQGCHCASFVCQGIS